MAESKGPFSIAWRLTAWAQCAAMITMLLQPYIFKVASLSQPIQGVTTRGLLDML